MWQGLIRARLCDFHQVMQCDDAGLYGTTLYSNDNDNDNYNFGWKIRSRILSFFLSFFLPPFLPPEEFSRLRDGGTQGGEGVVDVDSWRKSSAVIVAPPAPPVILVEITVPRYEYFKFCVSLAHDQIGSSPEFGGRLIGGFGG